METCKKNAKFARLNDIKYKHGKVSGVFLVLKVIYRIERFFSTYMRK